ncbi:MAG: hypothetical protein HRU14_03015 [Planctomycetes bacterium]|nr:hypothetical protein [Planctomycetota bacterium]
MKTLTISLLATLMVAVSAAGQSSSANTSLVSSLPYPTGSCADVWADGDLAFLARRGEGFDVIDVSDPSNPAVLFSGRNDLFIQDIQSVGDKLYCANASGNGQGLVIFDISNPASPTEIGSHSSFNLLTSYSLAAEGNHAYVASQFSNLVVVLDVSTPAAPVEVTTFGSQSPISQIRDVTVVGTKLYVSWLSGGFEIHDITNPANPTLEIAHSTPTSLFHNCWPLDGGTHVATTDEVSGGYLRVWDISNPANILQVSQWRAHGVAVMHNLFVVGTLGFITNYTEGLRIIDLSNPLNPEEAGFYDTFPMVNPFQFGAWGVYPGRDEIYVADFNTGFYVIDFKPATATLSAASTSLNWGDTIMLTLEADAGATTIEMPGMADLSFTVVQLPHLQPAPLLQLFGTVPAGASSGSLPQNFPLPAGNFPAYDVVFTLTIADQTNGFVFDQDSVTISLN